jgi:tetratricopeptide (TPR) repeat protein
MQNRTPSIVREVRFALAAALTLGSIATSDLTFGQAGVSVSRGAAGLGRSYGGYGASGFGQSNYSRLPSSMQGLPNYNSRPSIGNVGGGVNNMQRPSYNFPSTRPAPGYDRPTTLPGNLPGVSTRPNWPNNSNWNRPGVDLTRPNPGLTPPYDRPSIGQITRPNPGGPWTSTKPSFPNNYPNRPSINGNRPNINIGWNTNNNWNGYPNRPNWDVDPGFSQPSWGINNNWQNNWNQYCINRHHRWYNGCWYGYWSSSWYAPIYVNGIGWGLNSFYFNPYFVAQALRPAYFYDYSQPVFVNNYYAAGANNNYTNNQNSQNNQQQQALAVFDQGLSAFKSGQYVQALSDISKALPYLSSDPVVHEVRNLALFAVGDYQSAASGLNALLTSAPGMDWTTMSGLYGDENDYSAQLRRLEGHCTANPKDASAYFVLAYHYLVIGAKDEAVGALKVVTKYQSKDQTAKRMLAALEKTAKQEARAKPRPQNSRIQPLAANVPATDLVGRWKAKSGDTTIEVSIKEDSTFEWTASSSKQQPIQLTGMVAMSDSAVSFQTEEQGAIGGAVESVSENRWKLSLSETAPDAALTFDRVK